MPLRPCFVALHNKYRRQAAARRHHGDPRRVQQARRHVLMLQQSQLLLRLTAWRLLARRNACGNNYPIVQDKACFLGETT
jgi:hypothetical protein